MTVRPDALVMVGNRPSCQGCGAPLGKGYEYCNLCGSRAFAAPDKRRTVPASPPKVLPATVKRRKGGPRTSSKEVPRRELVIALLAMTCMAPFCTWLSSFGGLIGISAVFNEAFYGRFVVLLAAAGLIIIIAGDIIPASIPRRAAFASIGAGTVALTALDYVEIMRYNLSPGPSLLIAMPGTGIYLALALGTAIVLAVLLPKRRTRALVADRPVLRPGSPGSGPSARR